MVWAFVGRYNPCFGLKGERRRRNAAAQGDEETGGGQKEGGQLIEKRETVA